MAFPLEGDNFEVVMVPVAEYVRVLAKLNAVQNLVHPLAFPSVPVIHDERPITAVHLMVQGGVGTLCQKAVRPYALTIYKQTTTCPECLRIRADERARR